MRLPWRRRSDPAARLDRLLAKPEGPSRLIDISAIVEAWSEEPEESIPVIPTPVARSPRFEERCQAIEIDPDGHVATNRVCGAWADSYCLRCGLQVCREDRPFHHAIWISMGAAYLVHCDGRELTRA